MQHVIHTNYALDFHPLSKLVVKILNNAYYAPEVGIIWNSFDSVLADSILYHVQRCIQQSVTSGDAHHTT
jgi:hypothetical protein